MSYTIEYCRDKSGIWEFFGSLNGPKDNIPDNIFPILGRLFDEAKKWDCESVSYRIVKVIDQRIIK